MTRLLLAALLAALALAAPATAAPITALGDPMRLTTFGQEADLSASGVAVAHHPVRDEYLVVSVAGPIFGAGEVHGQLLRADGSPIAEEFPISGFAAFGGSAQDPDVAFNPTTGHYQVVYQRDHQSGAADPEGDKEIYGTVVEADGDRGVTQRFTSVGPTNQEDTAGYEAGDPSIVWSPNVAAGEDGFLVVYEAEQATGEFDIEARAVSATTGLVVGGEIRHSYHSTVDGQGAGGDGDAADPDVAYRPQQDNFIIVWHGGRDPGEADVWVRMASAQGTRIGDIGDDDATELTDLAPNGSARGASIERVGIDGSTLVTYQCTPNNMVVGPEICALPLAGVTPRGLVQQVSTTGPADGSPNDFYVAQPEFAWSDELGRGLVTWTGTAAPGADPADVERQGRELDDDGVPVADTFALSTHGADGTGENDGVLTDWADVTLGSGGTRWLPVWVAAQTPPLDQGEWEVFGRFAGEHAGAADADGDGVPAAQDCDDNDPARAPGRTDTPGNGVDEDCSGADTPISVCCGLEITAASVSAKFRVRGRRTRVRRLRVLNAAPGMTVRISCRKGRRCPKRTRKARTIAITTTGTVNLKKRVRGVFRPKARLEVRVTEPGKSGKVVRYKVRRKKKPKRTELCLAEGATTPGGCA